jgi:SHS2 domain-containing protein
MRAESRTLEHVGEWQIAIEADTLDDIFREVAHVIAQAVGTTHADVSGPWETITITARDLPTLLVEWANELLGRSEATAQAYGEIGTVRVRDGGDGAAEVIADVRGAPVDQWVSPLKAATYHALHLEQRGQRWHALLLFDV